ncbi:MAG: ArsR family transcriptional regulator [Planctomycetota bacterium]
MRLSSSDALVVCAYEDQGICEKVRLAGALTLNELEAMAASLSTARELIFYCG